MSLRNCAFHTEAHVVILASDKDPVKVFVKNPDARSNCVNHLASQEPKKNGAKHEETPAAQRDLKEFIEMGGKGDQTLFGYDGESIYPDQMEIKAGSPEAKVPVSKTPKSKTAKPNTPKSKTPKKNGK